MAYFAPYIDGEGLHMPTYEDRLNDLVTAYRSIFGVESELSESVPDYQLLSVFAKALDDVSALVLQAYDARNPLYASGEALDLLLPLYGLHRESSGGVPETDAAARKRISTALQARGAGTPDALTAAVRAALYVKDAKVYANETASTDSRGIPAHSIATVIYGGDQAAVAKAIYDHKAPGVGTYGSTTKTITDASGIQHQISFSLNGSKRVFVYLTLRRLTGCDEEAIQAALPGPIRDFITGLEIGEALEIPVLYAVAYAAAPELSKTFAVADIQANVAGSSTYTRDTVACAWNEKITCPTVGGVTINFTD